MFDVFVGRGATGCSAVVSFAIRTSAALATTLTLLVMTACGGDSESDPDGSKGTPASAAVTDVVAADLNRDGEFWLSLKQPLQEKLVTMCGNQFASEAGDRFGPDVYGLVSDIPPATLAGSITASFADGDDGSIAKACREAAPSLVEKVSVQIDGEHGSGDLNIPQLETSKDT